MATRAAEAAPPVSARPTVRTAEAANHWLAFLATFLGTVAVLAALGCVLAVVIDPRNAWGTGIFPPVLLDARSHKEGLLPAYLKQGPVTGLVLGSSRSLIIDPRVLDEQYGLRFFNFGVDAAKVEDELAVYDWARGQGARPRLVILGLDLEALAASQNPALTEAPPTPLQPPLLAQGWSGLLSSPAASRAALNLKQEFTASYAADEGLSIVQAIHPSTPEATFDADGYNHWALWDQERAQGTFNLQAEIASRCLTTSYAQREGSITGLSASREQLLARLIAEARADGAQVKIWITPRHPEAEAFLRQTMPYDAIMDQLRAYVASLNGPGVQTYDLTAIGSSGPGLNQWNDCEHFDVPNAERIQQALADS